MPTKFGEQPLRVELYRRRISIPTAADTIGVLRTHLRYAAIGRTRPSPKAIAGLTKLLGMRPDDLFTAEVLAKPYDASKNPWRS